MGKKIIISLIVVLILGVVSGGIFWWWQDQKEVRELNKNLPDGVRVVKSLTGEYRVVNKIDGYEFKVPDEWKGIRTITYYEKTEKDAPGISIDAKNGELFGIGIMKVEDQLDLESWIQENIVKVMSPDYFIIEKPIFNGIEVIRLVAKEQPLSEIPSYFFKYGPKVYYISGTSENSIKTIITFGRW